MLPKLPEVPPHHHMQAFQIQNALAKALYLLVWICDLIYSFLIQISETAVSSC